MAKAGTPLHLPPCLPAVRFQSWTGKDSVSILMLPVLTDERDKEKGTRIQTSSLEQQEMHIAKCPIHHHQHHWIQDLSTLSNHHGLYRSLPPPVSKSLCCLVSFFFRVDIIFWAFSLLPHIFLCKSEKMFCHLELSCQLKLAGVCTLGQESASFTGC